MADVEGDRYEKKLCSTAAVNLGHRAILISNTLLVRLCRDLNGAYNSNLCKLIPALQNLRNITEDKNFN